MLASSRSSSGIYPPAASRVGHELGRPGATKGPCVAETILLWFRRDLRLADNPALHAAVECGAAVVPVFVWDPGSTDRWRRGGSSRAWLARSLDALSTALQDRGSRLIVRSGAPEEVLPALAVEFRAREVFFGHGFTPEDDACELRTVEALRRAGVGCRSTNALLLSDPAEPLTAAGDPYRVFTPFFRARNRVTPLPALPAPIAIAAPPRWPPGENTRIMAEDVSAPEMLGEYFTPGESGARVAAERFFAEAAEAYADDRDRPDRFGTSRLSPHLAFGEISAGDLWRLAAEEGGEGSDAFLRQLNWREFAYHLLHHRPSSTEQPLRERFADFPWRSDVAGLDAWKLGMTGYPIVDAGMRELSATGWMHNRVRMVVASFLTKDLLIPWIDGAAWFWEMLVDADLASNTLGWQWVAGSGADAAPYFRIFNPVTQGERFDPAGEYVRAWIPELERVPPRWVHRPWEAPSGELSEAGVGLGRTYPLPILDHAEARKRSLAAYESVRRRA
jgi:deoxyribodipyrimidine photo-lyase